jgi:hypothetical protein
MSHPYVQAYHEYQVNLTVMLGADRSQAELEMRQVLEFEFELAKVESLNFIQELLKFRYYFQDFIVR